LLILVLLAAFDGHCVKLILVIFYNRSVIFFEFVLFVFRNLNLYLSLGQLSVSSLLSVLHIVILYFTVNL